MRSVFHLANKTSKKIYFCTQHTNTDTYFSTRAFCYTSALTQNMTDTSRLLREYDYSMFLQQPRLPAYLDGDIHLLELNSDRWHSTNWFFSILHELQHAHDTNPHAVGGGFIFSKTLVLEAWYQHRLFGLYMSDTVSLSQESRDADPFVMTRTILGGIKYIFPIFCTVDAAGAARIKKKMNSSNPEESAVPNDEFDDGCIECLWAAERVRGKGLGQRLVAELNCYAVENPIVPTFWRKMGYTVNPDNGETRRVIVNHV